MRTVQEVIDEIGSWVNVADELIARGVKGDRDECGSCPIAKYIISQTAPDSFEKISVDWRVISTWDKGGVETVYSTNDNIDSFIGEFDDGDYPELDNNPDVDEFWEEVME